MVFIRTSFLASLANMSRATSPWVDQHETESWLSRSLQGNFCKFLYEASEGPSFDKRVGRETLSKALNVTVVLKMLFDILKQYTDTAFCARVHGRLMLPNMWTPAIETNLEIKYNFYQSSSFLSYLFIRNLPLPPPTAFNLKKHLDAPKPLSPVVGSLGQGPS